MSERFEGKWFQESLGVSDGRTVKFFLSKSPLYPESVMLFVAGVFQTQNADYVIKDNCVIFHCMIGGGAWVLTRLTNIAQFEEDFNNIPTSIEVGFEQVSLSGSYTGLSAFPKGFPISAMYLVSNE